MEYGHEEVSGILGLGGSDVPYGLRPSQHAFHDSKARRADCEDHGLLRRSGLPAGMRPRISTGLLCLDSGEEDQVLRLPSMPLLSLTLRCES